jgi:nucleoid-associated protein EbfC
MAFNFKQVQQLQNKIAKMQEELERTSFVGTAGGSAVSVTMNGKYEITAVKLEKEAVDPEDVAMLEDLILAASKDAFAKASEAQANMMSSIAGGMNLPPGFGL